MEHKPPPKLKIILYIAGKDILSTLKNRTTIGIIIGVVLLILPSQLLPLILQVESIPTAIIYAPGSPTFSRELSGIPNTRFYQVNSLTELNDEVVIRKNQVIGLTFPDTFDSKQPSSSQIEVDGLIPHWTDPEETQSLINLFIGVLSSQTGSTINITLADEPAFPTEDTRGFETMFIIQMINAIMTISLVLVPQMLMAEKETHTLDALLVSPASMWDLAIGKGIAGSFYSFLAIALVLALNSSVVVHWGWLVVSVISGIVFAILVGLLVGLIFNNFQKATLVMSVIMITVFAPAFVMLFIRTTISPIIRFLAQWLPSGLMASLTQMSLLRSIDTPLAVTYILVLWVFNALLIGAIGLQIRKIIHSA